MSLISGLCALITVEQLKLDYPACSSTKVNNCNDCKWQLVSMFAHTGVWSHSGHSVTQLTVSQARVLLSYRPPHRTRIREVSRGWGRHDGTLALGWCSLSHTCVPARRLYPGGRLAGYTVCEQCAVTGPTPPCTRERNLQNFGPRTVGEGAKFWGWGLTQVTVVKLSLVSLGNQWSKFPSFGKKYFSCTAAKLVSSLFPG